MRDASAVIVYRGKALSVGGWSVLVRIPGLRLFRRHLET